MKKGTLFLIAASIMFLVSFIFVGYAIQHPEGSWPAYIPEMVISGFYYLYVLLMIVFLVLGLVFKFKKK